MIPGKYDIEVHRGGTFSEDITAENSQEISTDFEATYDSARLLVRPAHVQKAEGEAPIFEFTVANGRIVIDGTTITITIVAADTAKIEFDEGKYILELIKDATIDPVAVEIVDPLLYGAFSVYED
jgi:hypothetical protein